ncbi:MAG TPA: flippase [bacterium]|nr:flippase [bacterium]
MAETQKIKNIAKNTSYLTVALIIQKVISFFYFILLARNLGPDSLGQYYFAISFTTIFAIFIDLGLVNYLIRETAKTKEKSEKLLSNILGLKLITSFLSVLAVFLFINILGDYDALSRQLVYISSICMVLDSFTLTFFGAIRGFHNLKFESISSIIFQLIVLAVGWTFLILGLDLRLIMLSLVLASVFNFIYSGAILKFKIKMPIKFSFNLPIFKNILILSLPFAFYGIFQRLYTYLDSVLLSFFSGDYYVGIYQVAFKIIYALQFLPMAFVASLYPAMSYYWLNNKEQLNTAFRRSLDYLMMISIPISVAVFLLADQIIMIFKSGYEGALWPLRISILALVFIFVNFPIGSLLNACDRQKKNTRNMLITLIMAIILNIILIPKFQAVGASVVVLVSNGLMFILGIIECRKIITYKFKSNIINFLKILLASILMGGLIIILKNQINIFLLCFFAMILYFIILFLLGAYNKEDLKYILKSFKKDKAQEI